MHLFAKRNTARIKKVEAQATERDVIVFAKEMEIFPDFTPPQKVPVTIDGREYFTCANIGCKMRTIQVRARGDRATRSPAPDVPI